MGFRFVGVSDENTQALNITRQSSPSASAEANPTPGARGGVPRLARRRGGPLGTLASYE